MLCCETLDTCDEEVAELLNALRKVTEVLHG